MPTKLPDGIEIDLQLDCGTGAGGFKPGNTCATGKGISTAKTKLSYKYGTGQSQFKPDGTLTVNQWYLQGHQILAVKALIEMSDAEFADRVASIRQIKALTPKQREQIVERALIAAEKRKTGDAATAAIQAIPSKEAGAAHGITYTKTEEGKLVKNIGNTQIVKEQKAAQHGVDLNKQYALAKPRIEQLVQEAVAAGSQWPADVAAAKAELAAAKAAQDASPQNTYGTVLWTEVQNASRKLQALTKQGDLKLPTQWKVFDEQVKGSMVTSPEQDLKNKKDQIAHVKKVLANPAHYIPNLTSDIQKAHEINLALYEKQAADLQSQVDDPNNDLVNYQRSGKIAQYIQRQRTEDIKKERGLEGPTPTVVTGVWSSWVGSSTSTGGKALQVACVDELGAQGKPAYGSPKGKARIIEAFGAKNYEYLKAHVRATWESTQYALEKANFTDKVKIYRGIHIDQKKLGKQIPQMIEATEPKHTAYGVGSDMETKPRQFVELPELALKRNGAASASTKREVCNNWNYGSKPGKTRVVMRIEASPQSLLSLPIHGKNTTHESETILVGTHWKGWDAWLAKSPP